MTIRHMQSSLTFGALRGANLARKAHYKNAHGESPDFDSWGRADWLEALVGELGEYANISKKFRRGDMDEETFLALAKKELADAQTYLDILAATIGIDLGEATKDKFNEVSERVGSPVRLGNYGWYFDEEGSDGNS